MNLLPRKYHSGIERNTKYPTACCTVIFDGVGDSKITVASMDIHKTIDSQMVHTNIAGIQEQFFYSKFFDYNPILF